jgi:sugar O-acyltransferase (sialic acid O-acetyltransferase NeuD family)
MKKKLAIYGAGGLGREVLSMLKALPEWEVTGFYDDGKVSDEAIGNVRVLGAMKELQMTTEDTNVVIAIGNPKIKRQLVERLISNPCIHFPILIHPHALILDAASVKIGHGSIITAGVILTTDIQIGAHVLVNLNCTVGHDVDIGDYSSVMPGANIAGEVKTGKAVMIGSGANVLNGICVGDQSRIGAGAVVTKDVKDNTTMVGVPARPINSDS